MPKCGKPLNETPNIPVQNRGGGGTSEGIQTLLKTPDPPQNTKRFIPNRGGGGRIILERSLSVGDMALAKTANCQKLKTFKWGSEVQVETKGYGSKKSGTLYGESLTKVPYPDQT